ncbi:MAG: hypothetical protein GY696_19200 [Gammaproteobacteria bacterium]|nr:hypothetical protein [Gammaproteobacteria bacterium]
MPRIHKCSNCDYITARRHDLTRHLRTVHSTPNAQSQLLCNQCGTRFSRDDNLIRHMRTNHSRELMQMDEGHRENNGAILPKPKGYICEYCGNTFTRRDNLKIHLRRDHPSGIGTYDSYTPVPYEVSQIGGGDGGFTDSKSPVTVLQRQEAINGFISSHRIVTSTDQTGDPAAMFRWSIPSVTAIIYDKLLQLGSLKFQLALKVTSILTIFQMRSNQ